MVSLADTGGIVLNDPTNVSLNEAVNNNEVPDDNLPELESKPLITLVGVDDNAETSEVKEEKKEEKTNESGSQEVSGSHKGFLKILGGSSIPKLDKEEEVTVGTTMSVEDAMNIINLGEKPIENGGDGFLEAPVMSLPVEPTDVTVSNDTTLPKLD